MGRVRRKTNLSKDEQMALLSEYLNLTANRSRESYYGSVKQLCSKLGVSESYPSRLALRSRNLATGSSSTNDDPPRPRGRPRVITSEKLAEVEEAAAKWHYEFTFEEMAQEVDVSLSTLWRALKDQGWRQVMRKTLPRLNDEHIAARLSWAQDHRSSQWESWVDIDEKFFVTKTLGKNVKVPPGVGTPRDVVQHRSHVPMVMFIIAVARPQPASNFDGKLGIWRVAVPHTAVRSSKHHDKGDIYDQDVTMTAAFFQEVMTRKVFPAIRKKMAFASQVTVQLDGASPHTGFDTIAFLNKQGKARPSHGPNIHVVKQPAQSPDCNVLDLCIFNSMGTGVARLQRSSRIYDTDGLVRNVRDLWKSYDQETLEKGFRYKTEILECIIAAKGRNDYPLPHPKASQ